VITRMTIGRNGTVVGILVCLLAGWMGVATVQAQAPDAQPSADARPAGQPERALPADLSERGLIEHIKRSAEAYAGPSPAGFAPMLQVKVELIDAIDELLERYPTTDFRVDALILRLQLLADLARHMPTALHRLLAETHRLQESNPKGKLAESVDYYAIQAFVLGARAEGMSEEWRTLGSFERYEAFIKDHPDSEYAPVIWASLVRASIQLGRVEKAVEELKKFRAKYATHPAYRRAAGEVQLAMRIGEPLDFEFETNDAGTVRSRDYRGKVVLLHFWGSWNEPSTAQLDLLRKLGERYEAKGLQLIGVSVDLKSSDMKKAVEEHKVDWPIYFDGKGFENDFLVGAGVVRIPTVLLLDRTGTLRFADDGRGIEAKIEKLLAEEYRPEAEAGKSPKPADGGE
jgi:peroxiredoxin